VSVHGYDDDFGMFELRCFREDDNDANLNLRWTVWKTDEEVVALSNKVDKQVGLRNPFPLESTRRCWGLSKRKLSVEDVGKFLRGVIARDCENGSLSIVGNNMGNPLAVDRLLSEFFELSVSSLRAELNREGKFREGYLRKTPVSYVYELRMKNILLVVQVFILILLGVFAVLEHVYWLLAVAYALLFVLALLDIYLTRPTEPTRTMVLPGFLFPLGGPLLVLGYVLYDMFLRTRHKRWVTLRPSYLAYFETNYDSSPKGVFLLDHNTTVRSSSCCLNPFVLQISNGSQTISLHTTSLSSRRKWERAIRACLYQLGGQTEDGQSFAPIRRDTPAQWYADAKFLFRDIYHALNSAQHEIFIAGWMISPELRLVRTGNEQEDSKTTLELVLHQAVKRGVRVHVLLYREVDFALENNSHYVKTRLVPLGVQIIRHAAQSRAVGAHAHLLPGWNVGDTWWSHHEKLVVVDQSIAFVGGIDLAFGRYDDQDHHLTDENERIWPGKDYYNVRIRDFINLEEPHVDLVDRHDSGRMPWHDIHCCVGGDAARDVVSHFIARWNHELHQLQSFRASRKSVYQFLLPARYETSLGEQLLPYSCTRIQALRSVGPWSLSRHVDHSIRTKYLRLIDRSEHFIYIENQFFNSNIIATALANRLLRALDNNEQFKLFVVLPQWPAFEGMPHENPMTKIVLHFQHKTMDSVLSRLRQGSIEAFGTIEDARIAKLVSFCSLRKAEYLQGKLVSEQVYVHSKLMIVDDEKCIIGSANLNDRSLNGDRDSEFCVFIEDNAFVKDLRCSLFIEHLGLHPKDCQRCRMCSLERRSKNCDIPAISKSYVSDPFVALWDDTSVANAEVLETLFPGLQPRNSYRNIVQAAEGAADTPDPNSTAHAFQKLTGNLVRIPLYFLRDERALLPSFRDPKTFILPYENFI